MSCVEGGGILEEAKSGIPEFGEFCCLSTSRASVSFPDIPPLKVGGNSRDGGTLSPLVPGGQWGWAGDRAASANLV